MTEGIQRKREPRTALLLSTLCPGLGHLYCGRIAAGLAWSLVSMAPVVFALLSVTLLRSMGFLLWGVVLSCLVAVAAYLYAAVDSYRLAKRLGTDYVLKDCNRGVVYTLFLAPYLLLIPAIAVVIALELRSDVVEAFRCAGESMSPTLLPGDRFLVNKLSQGKLPDRGELIVFRRPGDRQVRFVKRVIGLPGDMVAVRGDDVSINGKKLEHRPVPASEATLVEEGRDRLRYETDGSRTYPILLAADEAKSAAFSETKVPQETCFVLGDHRGHATDSRQFGFVPLGDILGTAEYLYLPAKSWSRFGGIPHD